MKRLSYLSIFAILFSLMACGGADYSTEIIEEHPDGTAKLVKHYKEKDGVKELYKQEVYHPNGIKKLEGFYRDGVKDGKWSSWYKNGNLWSVTSYKEGKEHGKATAYFPNGSMRFEGEYKMGERVGPWKFFNLKGELVNEREFN